MNTHLLQVNLSPTEYWDIAPHKGLGFADDTSFFNALPVYLLARCPLCDNTYTATLDTYSLKHWRAPNEGQYIFCKMQSVGCAHFVRVHHFVNLNNVSPVEIRYIDLWSEVPCVMPDFLTDDVESYVVMHALPICRVEDSRFVSRYSLYTMTYFSADPKLSYAHRWKNWKQEHHFPPFVRTPMYSDPHSETWWDLGLWIKKGRLRWLDVNNSDLPLCCSSHATFPYANITGNRTPVTYREGKKTIS